MTDWFPANVKPVRDGVYETQMDDIDRIPIPRGFSSWRRGKWGNQFETADRAKFREHYDGHQDKKWRGLAEKPE